MRLYYSPVGDLVQIDNLGDIILNNTRGLFAKDTGGANQALVYLTNTNQASYGINTSGYQTSIYGSNIWCYPVSGTNFVVNNGAGFQPGGGPWASLSDSRIKRDIADYTTGLDAVLRLRPVTYQFNGRGFSVDDGRTHVGLVADEVEGVMPEMVGLWPHKLDPRDVKPSEVKTLNTNALTYALINAVKELAARVEEIDGRIPR
jgi:hypothetical protein